MRRDWKALKARRRELGVDCPGCKQDFPRRIPKLLLPGRWCPVCGYRDTRREEIEQREAANVR